MQLPGHYSVRPPVADDLGAVADVFAADDIDDVGEVVLDADFIRGAWGRSGFSLTTDAWVVLDQTGTIVAYAHAMRDGADVVDSWGIVHPAARGRGLGPVLLDRIETRAGELLAGVPGAKFRQSVNAGDDAAAAMLRARGLRPVRHFWHMGIDLDATMPTNREPPGIEIVTVDARTDLPAMHAVLTEAFAEDWGYHPESFDAWAEDYRESPNYDPTLWLLARDGANPVAVLAAQVLGDRGWISEIGVLKSHRGRGIADALLRRSFATFAERGFGRLMLNVDAENPTGATALYERVGMRIIKRWDLWERSEPLVR